MLQFFKSIAVYFSPRKGISDLRAHFENASRRPVVWLMGKTGAGKSSLIGALTGLTAVEIGNGYQPCTRSSRSFPFPSDQPIMEFLDTQGLGEAGYDPGEDLSACEGRSHVILVVARIEDPVQGDVAHALADVLRRQNRTPAIIVHTGADLISDDHQRDRGVSSNHNNFEKAVGRTLPRVVLALNPNVDSPAELDPLLDWLAETMPAVAMLLAREEERDAEQVRFIEVRRQVVFWSSAAGATDLLPIIGAVSVPVAQGTMLRMLGQHYGIPWTRGVMAEFLGAMGVGIAARFAASYGLRQLTKLLPVYGQTIGAAASGTVSFMATYALGRAAAYYLYQRAVGQTISGDALQEVFRSALRRRPHAAD
jgi:uncharacterized protein (DUF697 family)